MVKHEWRLTDRQQMIQAWGMLAFVRGIFYLPFVTEGSDFPAAVRLIVPGSVPWFAGSLWCTIGAFGMISVYFPRLERFWWPTLIGSLTAWAGCFFAAWLLGYAEGGWVTTLFYLALARGIWTSRGTPPKGSSPHVTEHTADRFGA